MLLLLTSIATIPWQLNLVFMWTLPATPENQYGFFGQTYRYIYTISLEWILHKINIIIIVGVIIVSS